MSFRVLGHLRFWLRTGGILALHNVLKELQDQGCEVRMLVNGTREKWQQYPDDSITTTISSAPSVHREMYAWADAVITQGTAELGVGGDQDRPLRIMYIHRLQEIEQWRVRRRPVHLLMLNSEWLAKEVTWPGESLVVFPPIRPKEFETKRGDRITLVNLGSSKRPELFWALARRMNRRRFLGVQGSWSKQNVPVNIPLNAEVIPPTSEMKEEVYRRTEILLAPAPAESWGMVGVEALASGIPVIAAPANGSKESLGKAGKFIDPSDVEGWAKEIQRLLENKRYYRTRSEAGLRRVQEIREANDQQIADLIRWMHANRGRVSPGFVEASSKSKSRREEPSTVAIPMRARRRFWGLEQSLEPGQIFYASGETHAQHLERQGLANRIKPERPDKTKTEIPSEAKDVSPEPEDREESQIEPVAMGGGWYALPGGSKIRGRRKALEALSNPFRCDHCGEESPISPEILKGGEGSDVPCGKCGGRMLPLIARRSQ